MPKNPPATASPLDRGDAVNLARNIIEDHLAEDGRVTVYGLKILADAVLRMDEELRRFYATPSAKDELTEKNARIRELDAECMDLRRRVELLSQSASESSSDNWTTLVREYGERIGCKYRRAGETFLFFGLVYGDDDYYYGMTAEKDGKILLASCVGTLEAMGFAAIDATSTSNSPVGDEGISR